MRLTTTITIECEVGGGTGTDGDESWDIPGRDVEVDVEVVGTVEDRGEEGLVVHVETVDGTTPSRWERELVERAREALESEHERQKARTEAA